MLAVEKEVAETVSSEIKPIIVGEKGPLRLWWNAVEDKVKSLASHQVAEDEVAPISSKLRSLLDRGFEEADEATEMEDEELLKAVDSKLCSYLDSVAKNVGAQLDDFQVRFHEVKSMELSVSAIEKYLKVAAALKELGDELDNQPWRVTALEDWKRILRADIRVPECTVIGGCESPVKKPAPPPLRWMDSPDVSSSSAVSSSEKYLSELPSSPAFSPLFINPPEVNEPSAPVKSKRLTLNVDLNKAKQDIAYYNAFMGEPSIATSPWSGGKGPEEAQMLVESPEGGGNLLSQQLTFRDASIESLPRFAAKADPLRNLPLSPTFEKQAKKRLSLTHKAVEALRNDDKSSMPFWWS